MKQPLRPDHNHYREGYARRRSVTRLLAQFEPRLRRVFLRAVSATQSRTDARRILRALEGGDIDAAIEAVPWDRVATPILRGEFMGEFRRLYQATGSSISASIAVKVGKGRSAARFSIVDPRPIEFLRDHGAELVDGFGLQSREGLRAALVGINNDGVPPVSAVKIIRQHVGLSQPFATAVANRQSQMLQAGASLDSVMAEATRYAAELRDLRALNIARTESGMAYGKAAVESMRQAAENDLLDPARATKTWRTAGDDVVRDEHADLDGDTIPWDETWTVDGEEVDGPPAGINCRCVMDVNPLG